MKIVCAKCGHVLEMWPLSRFACPKCGGYWKLCYDSKPQLKAASPVEGIRIFDGALPPLAKDLTSLGEGNTPLVEVKADKLGLGSTRILLKNETMNPTGSFKDRFSAVNCAVARSLGAKGVVCASTGNAAMAAVAYSNVNNLKSKVFVPETTPITIIDVLHIMGANVSFCDWDEIHPAIQALVEEGWFPATGLTAYPVATPFGAEGYKTIAYEIIRDMWGSLPDVIAVPVGGGDLLYGVLKGLLELKQQGVIEFIPTVLALQAERAAPLVEAYGRQLDQIQPLDEATSIAASINEKITGNHALDYLRMVGGKALTVSDDEIREASSLMAGTGVLAEYASAAALAGVLRAVQDGLIKEDSTAVCIATGSLLKWNGALTELAELAKAHQTGRE